MLVIRKLAKNGSATTVSIPPQFLDFARWRAGDYVVVEVRSREEFVIRPMRAEDGRAPVLAPRQVHLDVVAAK